MAMSLGTVVTYLDGRPGWGQVIDNCLLTTNSIVILVLHSYHHHLPWVRPFPLKTRL
jgi:hypothetical protein